MITIQLSGNDFVKDLEVISEGLKGKLFLNGGSSFTKFSNEFGKGKITGFRVSNEISALLFNVIFTQNIEFVYAHHEKECMDMFYCAQGSLLHKTDQEKRFETINFRQNAIINRLKSANNSISFPPHVPLEMSFISYMLPEGTKSRSDNHQNLRDMASNFLNRVQKNKDARYLGRICFRTSGYMQKIMSFSTENASDTLFKEAAILNTFASQLERYHSDINGVHANSPVKQYELDKILALEFFIKNNLTENLTIKTLERISGLGAIKLQKGFHYLFNSSINAFIVEKRLDKSAELLEKNELNISEIVYQIGFSSRSYFSKIFKKRFGMSPSLAIKNQVR